MPNNNRNALTGVEGPEQTFLMRSSQETNKAKHMTKRNKHLREIYLLAASLTIDLTDGGFTCCSISAAECDLLGTVYDLGSEARRLYNFLFSPSPNLMHGIFWTSTDFTTFEQRENRILALLFMSELARTDSLPTLKEIQTA
jgi:hypothetical protein